MYVAVKGGEKAIDHAHRLLADERRGDRGVPELQIDQIKEWSMDAFFNFDRLLQEVK